MSDYVDQLQRIIDEVVVPRAVEVDATAAFPREALEALGRVGILGLVVSTGIGGGGQGLRQAADVIRRLAGACGSTAMVVLMHYAGTVVIENHGPEDIRKAIAAGE